MIITEVTPRTSPPFPPRTRLYHLAPIGVGTPAVESLTGYLMRLAEAHCVSTGALVSAELLPLLQQERQDALPAATWLGRAGAQFNGTGQAAQVAVTALASLTGRAELAALTLLPWAAVVAPRGLLRRRQRTRAWCSACYADLLEQDLVLYEPLLWSLAAVTVCVRHQTQLSERCPHDECGRRLPLLAALARPGFCSWCRRSLARRTTVPDEVPQDRMGMQWGCWVAEQLGEFLAAGSVAVAAPVPLSIVAAIGAFTADAGGGQVGTHQAFARTVGIHANLVQRWRSERARPTMSMLLRMARALGVSLVELVTGNTGALTSAEATRSTTALPPDKPVRRPPAVLDTAYLRREVRALCAGDESPPPSGAAVARRLGCPASALSRVCPQEWAMLVGRHRTYRSGQRQQRRQELAADVRQAMEQVSARGLYPSFKRIQPLLQRRIHPRRTDLYVIRHRILQDLGWSEASRPHVSNHPAPSSGVGESSGLG